MLTKEQGQWIDHLSDTDCVLVVPHDPTCEEKFLKVKENIQKIFGNTQRVLHRGASALGISGQNEIDVYVPVTSELFDECVFQLMRIYGNPRGMYSLQRARFVCVFAGKHIDIFVINEEDIGWKDSERFYQILISRPDVLEEYRKLKEWLSGHSTREYYRRKIEFMNEVLAAGSSIEQDELVR